MRKVRGLTTRPCPTCGRVTPHRTLYVKTEEGGRTRWFQLFWACLECGTLNHIVLPCYHLLSASPSLPSSLCTSIVTVVKEGTTDINELLQELRRRRSPEFSHILHSDVLIALTYMKSHGVLAEERVDCTSQTLEALRAPYSKSKRLRVCPVEMKQGVVRKSLVSLYSERRISGTKTRVPVGVLCLHCEYNRVDLSLPHEPPTATEIPTEY